MRATYKFAKECFDRFNQECFGGVLPPIAITVGKAGRALGSFKYPLRYDPRLPRGCGECSMQFSARYDQEQSVIEDTVIHEMIHYYLWYRHIDNRGTHGPNFIAVMQRINREHGRHITVRHRSSEDELASDIVKRDNYVCVTVWQDGTRCVTSCARTRVFEIHEVLSHHPACVSLEWYYSRDPWFNRLPKSKVAKLYRLGDEDYRDHILTATRCVCDGRTFRPASSK